MYGIQLLKDCAWVVSERLPHGGTLQITPDGWQIQYTLIHPDSHAQYPKKADLFIPGSRVEEISQAWLRNFAAFEKMAESMPRGSLITVPGDGQMVIRLGNQPEGVSFSGDNKAICTRTALRVLLISYEYAQRRAKSVVGALAPLESFQLTDDR